MRAVNENRIKPDSLVLTVGDLGIQASPEAFLALAEQASPWGLGVGLHQSGLQLSLEMLRHKSVKTLRVGRALVERCMADEASANLCKAVLAVARQLGLTCLAEGADSASVVRFLAAHGCQMAAGAYFSQTAVAGEELLALKRQTWKV